MEHPEFRKSKEDSEQDGIKSLCTGKETHLYLWLIYVDAWQKPTQYCKAIILQLKKKNFFLEPLYWKKQERREPT